MKNMNQEYQLNTLWTRNLKMDTLTNGGDAEEMLHNAAFHQGLHCFLRQNRYSEK